jgi:hypothetical protein
MHLLNGMIHSPASKYHTATAAESSPDALQSHDCIDFHGLS